MACSCSKFVRLSSQSDDSISVVDKHKPSSIFVQSESSENRTYLLRNFLVMSGNVDDRTAFCQLLYILQCCETLSTHIFTVVIES